MKIAIARSVALHIAVILLLISTGACSTVAGVGQDVQDVANFTRNKIVEKVNAHQRQGLSQEEIDAVNPDFISPDNFEGSGGAPAEGTI